ncbi:MAG: ferrous iron transporter B [Clostridia bacterium]|nr:ferrous iron transporter B [Clostridia bacterium]
MRIALAGNPNSGKTTLFNSITGKQEHVGNWAGVTVDKKQGNIRRIYNPSGERITVIDLPGAYSASPYTSEETITKDFILNEKPDVIINIVDSSNLSRSLFFTTQLLEMKIPVVIALNKADILEKKGNEIDLRELSHMLNCPVIKTSAVKSSSNGLKELIDAAHKAAANGAEDKVAQKTDRDEAISDEDRFQHVKQIVAKVEKRKKTSDRQTIQDKADRIVASRWLGIPIFAGVIFLVFSLSQAWLGPWLADMLVGLIDSLYVLAERLMAGNVSPVLQSILLDGIIGGVGAVVGFLPLIMVLFFFLALLEDCGYMARVAMLMDRYFKKVGLSGKSIIPMVVGTGCAVPGIMATRTIKSIRQRRTTAMLAPFMPCGAKLPIIALFAGVFFGENGWIGTIMYFLGIAIIVVGAVIIRKITGDNSTSYFIIELPEYRWPSIKRAFLSMLSRAKAFIVKAGTVILVCNVIVQMLQTFTLDLQIAQNTSDSILAIISSPAAVLLVPLGFGMWQFAAAAITGLIAKENVVGTLAVVFSISNFINTDDLALVGDAAAVQSVLGIGSVAALSYLVFNLFTPPCVAAIAAMRTELESNKWFMGAIAFQLAMGYVLSFFVYQLGTLFTTGTFGDGFIWGLAAVSVIFGYIAFLMFKRKRQDAYLPRKAEV